MPIGRYVVCDTATKTILAGPFLLDPAANPDWQSPTAGTVMTATAALAGGYTASPAVADPADVLRGKIQAALSSNAAFLAVTSPTAAQITAQVKALTRQVSALGRLTLGFIDDPADS